MNKQSLQWQTWTALFGIVLVGFFYNLGAVPLIDLDEGAFTEATREMLISGDWISTYLNGEPRYDKPILIYWLQALSVSLFGLSEFALRLPSALAGVGSVLVMFMFMHRQTTEKMALLAAAMMALSFNFLLIFKAATADALLIFLMTSTLLLMYSYFQFQSKVKLLGVYALMALGVLTKGPVAVFFPFVISLIYFWQMGRLNDWFKAVLCWQGWLVFLAIAAPWYVAQYMKEGQAFIDGFILKHNVSRFSEPMESHDGRFWYYLPVVLLAMMPFTGLIFKAVQSYKTVWQGNLTRFGLIWFAVIFVFFSFSGTKLPHYINYALPGLVIVMAMMMDRVRFPALALIPMIVFLAFLSVLPNLAQSYLPEIQNDFYAAVMSEFWEVALLAYWQETILFAIFAMIAILYVKIDGLYKMILTGGVMAVVVGFLLLPVVGELQQQPIKTAAQVAKQYDTQKVLWSFNKPSFSVYVEQVTPKRAPNVGEIALTKISKKSELNEDYRILFEQRGVVLVERLR